MSKKAAEHHKQSAEHHTRAARHHGEAAKHHESGDHEKAAHHAHTARGHALHARHHSDEAAKAHMDNAIRRIEQADPAFWQQEGAQLARPLVEGWPAGK